MKNNMLYTFFVLLAAMACSGTHSDPQEAKVPLSADPVTLTYAAEGGEQTFTVTSADKAAVVPEDEWVSVNAGIRNSKTGKTVVAVTAEANDGTAERTTKIAVECGKEKVYVEVVQDPAVVVNDNDVLPAPGDNIPEFVSAKLGIGWNLGNHFDAYNNGVSGETAWGNPAATQATFDKLKAAGFNTVRIPVTWLGHIGGAPNYKIEEKWLDRVAEVVGYAERAGLNAIVNIHHDGADSKYWLDIKKAAQDPKVHESILAQINAMWTQIAARFKDKGYFLVFESFNEVHDGGWGWGANRNDGGKQYKCLNEWNQAFVDAVRATGGKNADRFLGVPAYCTNTDLAIESFELPEDSAEGRLMLAVHCYDPYLYTLEAQYSEWGHTADPSKKTSGDNEAELKRVFEKLNTNFVAKGVPVYMGEFGCVNRGNAREQAFQQYYLKYYAALSRIYGVPSIIWDNGAHGAGRERHAFFDHGTGEYCSAEAKAAIEAMIASYKSSHTLEEIYNSAPKY